MKRATDPRHLKRKRTVQDLFAYSFANQKIGEDAKKILSKKSVLDKIIIRSAPTWPIERINSLDLAILRLAVWELRLEKKNPPKVVIDEAIEIAKELGSENSPGFVNGVLGSIMEAKPI